MKVFAIAAASLFTLAAAVPNPGCQPGTYSCTKNPSTGGPGWQVCDVNGKWVFAGDCPPKTVCKFFPPSQSPYCVPADFQFP